MTMRRITYAMLLIANCIACYGIGRYGTTLATAEASETQTMRVTAYCAGKCCCGKFSDGITASGHVIRPGDKFCAAPKSIPFGTMIDIPGYGTVPVLDRGGAIKEGRLDVFFASHQAALNWGVKNLQVKIAR